MLLKTISVPFWVKWVGPKRVRGAGPAGAGCQRPSETVRVSCGVLASQVKKKYGVGFCNAHDDACLFIYLSIYYFLNRENSRCLNKNKKKSKSII